MIDNAIRNLLLRAADLLDLAEEQFSNHGCNDYELDDTEENRQLIRAAMRWVEYDDYELQFLGNDSERLIALDWLLMQYCAAKLRKVAKGDVKC